MWTRPACAHRTGKRRVRSIVAISNAIQPGPTLRQGLCRPPLRSSCWSWCLLGGDSSTAIWIDPRVIHRLAPLTSRRRATRSLEELFGTGRTSRKVSSGSAISPAVVAVVEESLRLFERGRVSVVVGRLSRRWRRSRLRIDGLQRQRDDHYGKGNH